MDIETQTAWIEAHRRKVCVECERVFDMESEVDAEEWIYGHDCE